ncbi:TIGR00341 family protein [Altererythrobacter marinus]|uniref:TIGR00341 family protein n=1 Tax=Pelagerythrobacter marinus TaxID=538382 RepID=A0ABW9V0V2_9SPHN|nr:TIGR00341 family protein [Pelagerythrobacter marinus]MXO69675.1 TIGR00341 family protein [Pelagerythrobacter marinus]
MDSEETGGGDTGRSPAAAAAAAVRRPQWSFLRVVVSFRRWWREMVVETVHQGEVIERRRKECALSSRYLFMTAMSAGIAILGLLLSSPAVVIGAMLLSPLMDPIMGLGFALAIGDYRWLRQSARSLAWGTAMAVGLCALIVFMSPLQDITPEIASRTRPSLFDLLVALFSALAGAYAMIRGREGTIVGVAIATALMPPLAVVGFGLATANWTVFWGALLLYITNFVTIALTVWAMARLYGFSVTLTERQSRWQNFVLGAVFVALVVPLGLSLRQIAWEAAAARQVRTELAENFGSAARLSQPEIEFDTDPMRVSAFVWTTSLQPDAEVRAEESLARALGTPVDVQLKQFLVRDEQSAEEAQLASAKAAEEEAARDRLDDLAARLAVAAGTSEDEVLLDRQRRRALVRAEPLPGAGLAAYAALEQRIAATEPEWRIELVPPVSDLPQVAFAGEEPDEPAREAIALAGWSAKRLGRPLVVSGPEAEAEAVRALLAEQGARVRLGDAGGALRLAWGDEATQ